MLQKHIFIICHPGVVFCCRILRKVPDLVEQFAERASSLLKANDGAVQLAGVTLMLQVRPATPHCVPLTLHAAEDDQSIPCNEP